MEPETFIRAAQAFGSDKEKKNEIDYSNFVDHLIIDFSHVSFSNIN